MRISYSQADVVLQKNFASHTDRDTKTRSEGLRYKD